MATEQDAARDRVLAARAELAEQVQVLEASGRAAIDIPARIKRSPAKAAAVAGTVGFVALKGPQRLFRAARRRITGEPAPMPKRMLPGEIEKSLKRLGDDGEKVRATLERDFADYVRKTEKDRRGLASVVMLAAARPLMVRGAKAVAEYLSTPGSTEFSERLAQVRGRAEGAVDSARQRAAEGTEAVKDAAMHAKDAAEDRVSAVRHSAADAIEPDEPPPPPA